MSSNKVNYESVDAVGGGLHFLRDPLSCEKLGVSVLECEPGFEGMAHDHADDGQEEVYVLVEGRATITIEDEAVSLEPGDAVRVSPASERQIHDVDAPSRFVIAGAP